MTKEKCRENKKKVQYVIVLEDGETLKCHGFPECLKCIHSWRCPLWQDIKYGIL